MESKYKNKFKIGDRYGLLSVIDGNIIMENEAKLKVRCECGNEKIVTAFNLIKGRCISCGCQMNKSGDKHPSWNGGQLSIESKYRHLISNANQRNLLVDVDIDYLMELLKKQKYKCPLSSLRIDLKNGSVDRIDSSIGYTKENTRWIHKDINIMKNSYSDDYFKYMCKLVSGIETEEVLRDRFRGHVIKKIVIEGVDGTIYNFDGHEQSKSFIDSINVKENLNGPSRISWNALIRGKKSKGWKIIK